MKKSIRFNYLFVIMSFLVLSSSCVTYQPQVLTGYPNGGEETFQTAYEEIEDYFKVLCSPEFDGRMPGTPGNDRAAAWLAEKLNSFGIEPFTGDDYNVGYTGWSISFTQSEMTVTDGSGNEKSLVQGVDFYILLGQESFNTVVTKDKNNYKLLEAGEEADRRISGDSDDIIIYFENMGYFIATTGSPAGNYNLNKTVQVSDEVFAMLRSGEFTGISIVNEVNYDSVELNNVVGVIKGNKSDNCVVLSAHFDFLGSLGEEHFPGALDNASRTSSLLYIAERLQALSASEPFDYDIVIAFFNSEEYFSIKDDGINTIGSRAFVQAISESYENIYNINIDCVGYADDEVYAIGRSGSSVLDDAVAGFAAGYGITCDLDGIYPGDNVSFLDEGIPSVYFNAPESHAIVHASIDTYDKLSIKQIIKMSDMIVDFLSSNRHVIYIWDKTASETTSEIKTIDYQTLLVTIPELPDMIAQFSGIVERVLAGEDVNINEEFYKNNKRLTVAHYYSYGEYMSREPVTNIEYIHALGGYNLRFIETRVNSDLMYYYYVNNNKQSQSSAICVVPVSSDEQLLPFTILPIPDIDGFFNISVDGLPEILGFYYNDSNNRFFVYDVDITADTLMPVLSVKYTVRENIEDLSEFIQTLQFANFIENWGNVY